MTEKPLGWRIWAVVPDQWMLRGIYIGQFWKAPALTAECFDTPRHQSLDPSCTSGVYTFARLEDAILDAVVQKTFSRRWERRFGPTEIVLVLGLVELTGTITEVARGKVLCIWLRRRVPTGIQGPSGENVGAFRF